jgi:ribosomal protein L14E/L6E/L27E
MVRKKTVGLRLGQKVTSTQGRDFGQEFLVVGFVEDSFLLVANGKGRSVERPKKKNIKHISISLKVDELIENKLSTGGQVTDDEIYKAIQRLGERMEEGEMNIG